MNVRRLLLIAGLFLVSCKSTTPPSRQESNQLAMAVGTARTDLNDRAAGTNAAIGYTAGKLPESREKEVIQYFVSDQYRLLGTPRVQTQTEFEKAAQALLSPDASERTKGETLRGKLQADNQVLVDKLTKAEADFKAAREREQAEHKAELEKVRQEAEAQQKRFISWIFFGGGAILLGVGVIILLTAAHNPLFGPRVGFGVIGAGAMSIFMGVLVLQLMKQLDEHPWIVWVGGGGILLLLTGAGAIAWANHAHHTSPTDGKS